MAAEGLTANLRVSGSLRQANEQLERKIEKICATERSLRQSEERYRAFVQHSSEGIWRIETEQPIPVALPPEEQIERFYCFGYMAECNDVMARMYGYEKADEFVGTRLGDFLIRTEAKNVEMLHALIASGYRLLQAESRELDRHGQTKCFSNNVAGIVENGLLVRVWGTQLDVSERQRAEEQLRDSEALYQSLVANLPQNIFRKDLQGRFTFANQRFCDFGACRPSRSSAGPRSICFRKNWRPRMRTTTGVSCKVKTFWRRWKNTNRRTGRPAMRIWSKRRFTMRRAAWWDCRAFFGT